VTDKPVTTIINQADPQRVKENAQAIDKELRK